jgi:hypothetical protein
MRRVFILALVTRHANCVFSALHSIVTCGLYGATMFLHVSHKKHNFRREVTEHNTFLNLSRIQRDNIIKIYRSLCKVLAILFKLQWQFSWQRFEKKLEFKLHKDPCSGSWVVPIGQTDRHDKANSHFLRFWWNLKNESYLIRTFFFVCFVFS